MRSYLAKIIEVVTKVRKRDYLHCSIEDSSAVKEVSLINESSCLTKFLHYILLHSCKIVSVFQVLLLSSNIPYVALFLSNFHFNR